MLTIRHLAKAFTAECAESAEEYWPKLLPQSARRAQRNWPKLLSQSARRAQRNWPKLLPQSARRAQRNWPKLLSQSARRAQRNKLKALINQFSATSAFSAVNLFTSLAPLASFASFAVNRILLTAGSYFIKNENPWNLYSHLFPALTGLIFPLRACRMAARTRSRSAGAATGTLCAGRRSFALNAAIF
jgi:hypothetical protein